jgi:hypothetical protein
VHPLDLALCQLPGAIIFLPPVVFVSSLFAASLLGDVTEVCSAAVPSATIVPINVANNQRTETRSDSTGPYVLSPLQPGVHIRFLL